MTDETRAAGAPKLSVTSDCDAWCGRCKATTTHTIVAMVDGKPKQVACGTCNDWHRYSKPKAGPPAPVDEHMVRRKRGVVSATGPRRGRLREAPLSAASTRELWKAAIDAAPGQPQDYDYRGGYAVGDVVQHPTFGLCIVTRKESPRRAIVLTKDGEKALLTPGARNR